MDQLYKIFDKVKKEGYKLTQQRKNIILIFYENRDYLLEPSQIFKKLLMKNITINFSTVYRNLDFLTSIGILRKVSIKNGISTYELEDLGGNHHLICLNCGKVKAIETCPYKDMDKSIFYENDFFPEEHKFEVYGYCRKCMKEKMENMK